MLGPWYKRQVPKVWREVTSNDRVVQFNKVGCAIVDGGASDDRVVHFNEVGPLQSAQARVGTASTSCCSIHCVSPAVVSVT